MFLKKKEVQREEGVTLCCSRLHLSRTEAKLSLHRVRGIVCCTHMCEHQCQSTVSCLSSLNLMPWQYTLHPNSCLISSAGWWQLMVFSSPLRRRWLSTSWSFSLSPSKSLGQWPQLPVFNSQQVLKAFFSTSFLEKFSFWTFSHLLYSSFLPTSS